MVRAPTAKSTAAASSSSLKGQRLRFRVVETPGQVVGLSDPYQKPPPPYPFTVLALKTSQTVYIEAADLADILSTFHGSDADTFCRMLRAEFQMCAETLKPRGADAECLAALGLPPSTPGGGGGPSTAAAAAESPRVARKQEVA